MNATVHHAKMKGHALMESIHTAVVVNWVLKELDVRVGLFESNAICNITLLGRILTSAKIVFFYIYDPLFNN